MSSTLLATKLFIPQSRPRAVHRPRLIVGLNAGLGTKLTLVSAPAGFGKTTIVSAWVHQIQSESKKARPTSPRTAWLSLDEGDNDLARFLAYFITALNQVERGETSIGKGALGMLQLPQTPPSEAVLTSLINEVAALPYNIIFVLDDYHLIEAQTVHDALAFLLDNMPPQLQLVIVTRVDPPLPLARLRARDQLTELRAAVLRFSSSEAAAFLNQVMGLDLTKEDIAALETRTEGWIAGLQLAAISMQGRKDSASLIKSFTGSHRFVLDYLVEEVLHQQPESVQKFLLQTAVLSRLTGSLCEALTGQKDGRAILEFLDNANLFIFPLDEERHWYRYHHLFADILRQHLHQAHPEQFPVLYQRASEWYEQNGFTDEAVDYALRADDFERAGHLIEGLVDVLWELGDHAKLQRWLFKLPIELITSKPRLCIFNTWYSFVSGQQDAAEQCLQAIEQTLDSSTEMVRLRGRAAAIRAFMDAHQGNVQGIIKHAHQALEYLPEQDRIWRSITALTLGDVYGFKGDITSAYKARFLAYQACKATGNTYYTMLASMKLAITLRSQGRLQQTLEICQQQIQSAHESGLSQTPLGGLLLLICGEVLVEINDLDAGRDQAIKGIDFTERSADMAFLGWSYMCQMRILFSRGELSGVEEIIENIGKSALKSNVPPWIVGQMAAWQARIWLAQNKLEAASQWAQERGFVPLGEPIPEKEINFFSLFDYIILARILIAQGRLDEAARLLEQLLMAAKAGGRTSRMVEILNLQALTFQAMGDLNQALAALEGALALAEPEGFIRSFADEGPPMARLLYEALSRGIASDYVSQLLGAFHTAEPKPSKSQAPQAELIESLSERELEVLELIAAGLTNPEIAARLYLSLNTVKVHARNIYGKLGVNNRTQAGSRARALGILDSH